MKLKTGGKFIIAKELEEKNMTDGGLLISDQEGIPPKAMVLSVPKGCEEVTPGDIVLFNGAQTMSFISDVRSQEVWLAISPDDVIAVMVSESVQ